MENKTEELYHHGVPGMKWGVRRYQNKDGSLTSKGRKRMISNLGKSKFETLKKKFKVKDDKKVKKEEPKKEKTVKEMSDDEFDAEEGEDFGDEEDFDDEDEFSFDMEDDEEMPEDEFGDEEGFDESEMEDGDMDEEFNPETDYAVLDWGRGVWTYDNTWYWGSGNARIDGHRFGFNLGYGFGNTSAATENVIFWDGRAHKLDDVKFCIPNDNGPDPLNGTGEQVRPGMSGDMDSPEYMKEWTFTSSDGRFEAVFRPVLDRSAKIDLKAIISDQHQVFGLMSGTAVLDDGTPAEFKNVLCFAEKVHNQY